MLLQTLKSILIHSLKNNTNINIARMDFHRLMALKI